MGKEAELQQGLLQLGRETKSDVLALLSDQTVLLMGDGDPLLLVLLLGSVSQFNWGDRWGFPKAHGLGFPKNTFSLFVLLIWTLLFLRLKSASEVA